MKKRTLALNMIVGPGDSAELKRCLDSIDAKLFFDEIVIVVTTEDELVLKTAMEYTNKVYKHQWTSKRYPHGNFALARNKALDNTVSDYVMWLDADDEVDKTEVESLNKFHIILNDNNFDYYLASYILGNNEVMVRERVWKNNPTLRWRYPVHENISINEFVHSNATINGLNIYHKPLKDCRVSLNRNMKILEHEHLYGDTDSHLKYCYAKEMYNISILDENDEMKSQAIKLYEKVLSEQECSEDNLAVIAFTLAMEYGDTNNQQKAETYARISMGFSDRYAEPAIILGDVYSDRGIKRKSIEYYKQALTKKNNTFGVQNLKFYNEIPREKLMIAYCEINEPEKSLCQIKQLLKIKKSDIATNLRKNILTEMLKFYTEEEKEEIPEGVNRF